MNKTYTKEEIKQFKMRKREELIRELENGVRGMINDVANNDYIYEWAKMISQRAYALADKQKEIIEL